METAMRHPDLFDPAEAAFYLRVAEAQLPTLEKEFGLLSHPVGRVKVYYRKDLDRTALRIVGIKPPAEMERPQSLRMAK